ncbi:hypothetical protein NQZ68_012097 [Dissostichus eleginoides]|nr:hypothetical protein NQZ68_012097 [Dissostichus eleginoides]
MWYIAWKEGGKDLDQIPVKELSVLQAPAEPLTKRRATLSCERQPDRCKDLTLVQPVPTWE